MRTKTVFTDISTIAHLWAHQEQDEARSAGRGNFYFNGKTIYSYGSHFPIATHVTNAKGEKAVLFTTGSYSNTTSKHIHTVRSAANHLNIIYCSNVPRFDTIDHQSNFNGWLKNIENIAPSLANARKPEKYLALIAAEYAQAERYAQFFGLKIPKDLQKAGLVTNSDDLIKYQKAKKAREDKELKKRHEKALKEWRTFKTERLYVRDGYDYLRINTEKNRIQTSQYVEIPMDVARVFFKTIIDVNGRGGCNNCDIRLLNWDVAEINSKYIRVGCHKITITEINTIAKQLNWA